MHYISIVHAYAYIEPRYSVHIVSTLHGGLLPSRPLTSMEAPVLLRVVLLLRYLFDLLSTLSTFCLTMKHLVAYGESTIMQTSSPFPLHTQTLSSCLLMCIYYCASFCLCLLILSVYVRISTGAIT